MKKRLLKIHIYILIVVCFWIGTYGLFKNRHKIAGFAELVYLTLKNEQIIKQDRGMLRLQNLVSHAGGKIKDLTYTNSLEALNLSYRNGFRFIELDFEWTSDGHLVLIHDWVNSLSRLFNAPAGRCSLEEYKKLKMVKAMTHLSLEDLARWLKQHPDVFIITDIKHDNLDGLSRIKERFPELVQNFIPQIYHFVEYSPAYNLGYKQIILTLYVANYSDAAVLRFARKYPLIAVTMPIKRALTDLARELKKIDVLTFAHTVNEESLERKLYANAVFGVYTDSLAK